VYSCNEFPVTSPEHVDVCKVTAMLGTIFVCVCVVNLLVCPVLFENARMPCTCLVYRFTLFCINKVLHHYYTVAKSLPISPHSLYDKVFHDGVFKLAMVPACDCLKVIKQVV